MNQRALLETIEDAENLYGALCTTRLCPRRDVLRAVRAGLARSVGMVRLVDQDRCAIVPARRREGFRLTAKGRRLV